jgi:2-phosphosulfolactate phosphatase
MGKSKKSKIVFRRATLESCGEAQGLVVVIDVLRAFSTAAYAFGAGAKEIVLAGTLDEARELQSLLPDSLLMGEVGGRPVEDFDLSNSPAGLAGIDLSGRRLIQRTSAGTQGVVRSTKATTLLAGSFVVASATVRAIQNGSPQVVTFVVTGAGAAGWGEEMITVQDGWGDEDAACADFIEAFLKGEDPDSEPFLRRVWDSPAGRIFTNPAQPEFPPEDMDYCARVDVFDFAMSARRENGLLLLSKI